MASAIYNDALISKRISLTMAQIGSNLDEMVASAAVHRFEGKCIAEGFVKPGSVQVQSRSAGRVEGLHVHFDIAFACLLCLPVEDMVVECIARTITDSAGIRAEIAETPTPMVIYLARDHHLADEQFSSVAIGDKLHVRVLGQRFELNDKYISIIGQLVSSNPTGQSVGEE